MQQFTVTGQTEGRPSPTSPLPYIRTLAKMGIEKALREGRILAGAMNIHRSKIVHKTLAEAVAGG